jgi:hypothetical protein
MTDEQLHTLNTDIELIERMSGCIKILCHHSKIICEMPLEELDRFMHVASEADLSAEARALRGVVKAAADFRRALIKVKQASKHKVP